KGKWYDFYTGEYVGNGEVLTVTPGLNKIPVYVKDGGIIPMMPPVLHAPKKGEKVDLEIRYYGEKSGRYLLYDDDGETFNYEKGKYSWREIKVERLKKEWKLTFAPPVKDKPNTFGNFTWTFMTVPAK